MKTFEIQKYEKSKWVHDCYLESADLAVAQARHMADSGRYNGIRVVQDEFTENKSTSTAKFLFVSRPTNAPAPKKPKPGGAARRRPPEEVQLSPSARRRASAQRAGMGGVARIILTLGALLAVGLAAHYALQTLFQ